jgi:hypothetical protein
MGRFCCRCTGLTSLDLSVFEPNGTDAMLSVGGIPWDITALQRLQRLRLDECVTAPLPRSIGRMTQLTSLSILQKYVDDNKQLFENYGRRVVRCDEAAARMLSGTTTCNMHSPGYPHVANRRCSASRRVTRS